MKGSKEHYLLGEEHNLLFVCVSFVVYVCDFCGVLLGAAAVYLWLCDRRIRSLMSDDFCFPRDYGTAAKAVMSIGMVHTESQSASETMFKLESKWMPLVIVK